MPISRDTVDSATNKDMMKEDREETSFDEPCYFTFFPAIFCLLGRKVGVSRAQLILCISVIITIFMATIGFFEVGSNNIGNIVTIIAVCS